MRYSFFFIIYTSTIYRISFILLHMYSTLCFGKSSATLSCYRTLHPSLNFRSHVRRTVFSSFLSSSRSLRPSRSITFSFFADNLIRFKVRVHRKWCILLAAHSRVTCTMILRAHAHDLPSHNRVSRDERDDSGCDDGGRVAIL